MRRDEMLERLTDDSWRGDEPFDLLVVGGGATGVGIAVDAAARGYRTALVEQSDFGKGTSSRSTKLVHGGVRYLQQGNVPLVMEALKERGILRHNAPHLVTDLKFVVPNYAWWEAPFYGIGMKVYDALAGRYGFGASRNLSREETIERLPTIETEGLRGGVEYHDGQFDDARLLVDLAQTAAEQGAVVVNYAQVVGLLRGGDGFLRGAVVRDAESGREHEVLSRLVINATGAFSDGLRQMDDEAAPAMIRPSQGVHLVLPKRFLPGDAAVMVPHTDDGRVLFAIPWLDRVVVGTTDTPLESVDLEPRAHRDEVDFLVAHAARYLADDPTIGDVCSVFAGIRPLVGGVGDHAETAKISREHSLVVSQSGLLTVAGGKWTTYRKMAEDAVDNAALLAELPSRDCSTKQLNVHGFHRHSERFGELASYGSDAPAVQTLQRSGEGLGEPLDPALPITPAHVLWAAREEMARTVDDVLARRTRCLLLDAAAAARVAEPVARLLAEELQRDEAWARGEVDAFRELAAGYLPEERAGEVKAPAAGASDAG
ncbi:MAG: glycerol-3-phosphate dehydrogenase/oxidase [Acidobacteria bacterium]|nr:MAG: glycerol-3-phosphate dehydrogenase/oxidase [Acidobacteriota bacterium]REJ99502.1 MAG: glycerol-3-phosphate dehydrogenase/oxidase [Acidobacteriota bacterium]